PGRGTPEGERPPIPGLRRRGGEVVVRMLADVRRRTIRPVGEAAAARGALVHTDEDDVHARLEGRGRRHETVRHARGEDARDGGGDGSREVHVSTAEGPWSLLRP